MRRARFTRLARALTSLTLTASVSGALALGLAPSAQAAGWTSTPADLSTPGASADQVDVAVDAAGNATAVWRQPEGATYGVYAATRSAGGAWSAPVRLSVAGVNASGKPQVAVNTSGQTVAVWASAATGEVVQCATRQPGGAWTARANVSASSIGVSDPQVGVAANGDATVVWREYVGQRWRIRSNRGTWPAAWTGVVSLSAAATAGGGAGDPSGFAEAPVLAVNAAGQAVVGWLRTDDNGYKIAQGNSFDPTTGLWRTVANLSTDPTTNDAYLGVSIDPVGNTGAVWTHEQQPSATVQVRTGGPTGGWNSGTDLPAGGSAVAPDLGHDSAGNLVVVWSETVGSFPMIRSASRPVGGAWSPVVTVSPAGSSATLPKMAFDGSNRAVVAWRYGESSSTQGLRSATRSTSGAWTLGGIAANPDSGIVQPPSLAVDTAGHGYLVWSRKGAGQATFGIRASILDDIAPTGLGITVPATGSTGTPVTMNATGTDTGSGMAATKWTFGDTASGTDNAASGATPGTVTHTYNNPGTYTVTATLADNSGNGTTTKTANITITGAPVTPPGSTPSSTPTPGTPGTPPTTGASGTGTPGSGTPGAGKPTTGSTAPGGAIPQSGTPAITAFTFTPAKLKAKRGKSTATITLSTAAKVELIFTKVTKKKGKKAATSKRVGVLSFTLKAGANRIPLTARLAKKTKLRPGSYQVTATATALPGDSGVTGSSAPRTVTLTVTR